MGAGMLGFYRAATSLGAPLVRLYLHRRARRGREDRARLGERLGQASAPRPDGALVWLHAASVGESASVLPLIERLHQDRSISILVTTVTVTSARLLAERLPGRALHQYLPVDTPAAVRGFLDHWRPDLALWVESELWPNLLAETQARKVPAVMIQGRMSERSFRRWSRWRSLIGPLIAGFRLVVAQTEADAERYRALGARAVTVCSTLKYAALPLAADTVELNALQRQIGARALWLAASTHAGEEAAAITAHLEARPRLPDLLTFIVPRHPERGPEVAALARAQGLTVSLRTAADPITRDTDVYVADTLGELGLFYRLAPLVFVGGSLTDAGGHNPIEPIQLGAATVTGPGQRNFAEVSADLEAASALRTVADGHQLATTVADLLRDPAERAELVRAQKGIVDAKADALEQVMAALKPYIPRHPAA